MHPVSCEVSVDALRDFRFPSFTLRGGRSVGLALPVGWGGGRDAVHVHEQLRTAAQSARLVVAPLSYLAERDVTRWERFVKTRISAIIAKVAGMSLEAARAICERCRIPPDQLFADTQLTERVLLDFEISASFADIVVVQEAGMDYLGRRRLEAHVQASVHAGRFAVLVLFYPRALPPKEGDSYHPKLWTDEVFYGTNVRMADVT
ncbi:hypothetical protein LY474_02575 [Myxococcus stipitatus]|uniref:hypothetical protein n=1 Tax=Myxococcus stipitatus TaxID=83455 RepID=UPI001F22C996|nr:hypothetical protein [Myxococcus stipitatus]MCE9666687.1 hypothetical protein [Myxococcus stipitatus]